LVESATVITVLARASSARLVWASISLTDAQLVDPRKYLRPARTAMTDSVEQMLRLLGGHATPNA
jgi:fructose/tagatose bisphosphate aldolase